ncbi:MAG: ComEC family DNA internalization-related competence protein [Chloroflexota bacterium]|nr:MAG: ComEC family DNA internalization-related competence protein [Chloroflexota bacterium]
MPGSGWIVIGTVLGAILVRDRSVGGIVVVALGAGSGLLAGAASIQWVRRSGRSRGRAAAVVRWLILVVLGVLLVAGRSIAIPRSEAPAVAAELPAGRGPWPATVITISPPRAGQQLAVIELTDPAGLRVASTLPGFPIIVPGDRVTVSGALRAPPSDDPYGAYLARIGITATIRASGLSVLPEEGSLARSLEALRRGADQALRRAIPEPQAGLASGILIGLRDRVDRDLSAAFTTVGATHVVAISGWNIAIVATTLAAVAGRVARRRRVALTALAIVAYVAFVGPSPSVVRAAAMAGVVMGARELGRPSRAAAAIGWAGTGLLVLDPSLVDDVGFQLSALATVGLIAWATPFTERLAGKAPGRLRAWLAESLGVSLAAQLATLPIVVLTFGRLSLVSPVVNLGVVPLVAPAMGAGVVAMGGGLLAMAGLPAIAASLIGLPAWLLFSLMVGVVRAGAGVPFASVQLADPWPVVVAAAAAMAMIAATIRLNAESSDARPAEVKPPGAPATHSTRPSPGRQRGNGPVSWWRSRAGRLAAACLAGSVAGLAVAVVHQPDGTPRVVVLDVGQGDAILVEGGHGGRLLIDGGPDPGRLLVALDEHLPPWDRRIDVMILSHPHEDHAAGLAALIDRYAVGQVYEPGMFGPGPGYQALNAELTRLGIRRGTLATGDRLRIDEFAFRVMWPDPGSVPERPTDGGTGINNVSIVLLGEVDGHRVLLAGDVEEQIDPHLLAEGLPTVDLLKVAHHGSRTSSTEALVAAVRPSFAVISAGRGNPYGHPAPATVARLTAAGARVLRTDEDGTVTVDLGIGRVRVRSTGARTAVSSGAVLASAPVPSSAPPATGAGAWAGPAASPFFCALPLSGPVAVPPPASPSPASEPAIATRPWTGVGPALRYDAVDAPPPIPLRPLAALPAAAGGEPGRRFGSSARRR